jgi:hypothetical protein
MFYILTCVVTALGCSEPRRIDLGRKEGKKEGRK